LTLGPAPDRFCSKRAVLGVTMNAGKLLSAVLLGLFMAGCPGVHTRTESVYVTEIEGIYRVSFASRGTILSPLTPEGPFPQWSSNSTFQTGGEGEPDGRGGTIFVLGRNLASQYEKYDRGKLIIRGQAGELGLDAELSQSYQQSPNHSGTYSCVIERPQVHAIDKFPDQGSMLNQYIVAVGRYSDYSSFISGSYTFEDRHVDFVARGNFRRPGRVYRVIGLVERNPSRIGSPYAIRVFSAAPLEGEPTNSR